MLRSLRHHTGRVSGERLRKGDICGGQNLRATEVGERLAVLTRQWNMGQSVASANHEIVQAAQTWGISEPKARLEVSPIDRGHEGRVSGYAAVGERNNRHGTDGRGKV